MNLIAGQTGQFIVDRKTDIGYILKNTSEEEVFLHFKESNNKELIDGQKVSAFLYYDAYGRLAATLDEPYITALCPGFLVVKDIKRSLGVFLDNGILKNLLLSKDDLPLDYTKWPNIGDTLYVSLKVRGNLVAKIVKKEEVTLVPGTKLEVGNKVEAYVLQLKKEGMVAITKEYHIIFIYKLYVRDNYRLGQEIVVTIINATNNQYNGSLVAQKESQMTVDATFIKEYLIECGGTMTYGNESSPEEILKVFKMSKKAFKRALGCLYKGREIYFIDNKTVLKRGNYE